jgi:hypothetical protein
VTGRDGGNSGNNARNNVRARSAAQTRRAAIKNQLRGFLRVQISTPIAHHFITQTPWKGNLYNKFIMEDSSGAGRSVRRRHVRHRLDHFCETRPQPLMAGPMGTSHCFNEYWLNFFQLLPGQISVIVGT